MPTEAGKPGTFKDTANQEQTHTTNVTDAKGLRPLGEVTTHQTPSAHEFGHAIGLEHVHCAKDVVECYGVTAEEVDSVMGKGMKMKVIERNGKVTHNDFQPFIDIAKEWGKDVFPGSLARLNTWTGTQG